MTKLEIQLYTALKGLFDDYVNLAESGDSGNWDWQQFPVFQAAQAAMAEVELELGPLPDWATAHNLGREAVQYAQLCTKDGERTGNAVIAEVPNETNHSYFVITDMGNPLCLSAAELAQMFTIGPWIMDERAVMKRKRQNPEAFGEYLSLWDQAQANGQVEL